MKDTQEKLLAKEEEVEQVENELIQARIDAENQYESMKVRIKFMYEGGNTQLIEMLFESESMGDFLNKAEYISQISEYDRNELIRYQDTVKRVEEKEARVQAEYDELSDLQEQLVNQQAEVEDLIESNAAQIADIQSQIDENQETLQELKEKRPRLNASVRSSLRRRRPRQRRRPETAAVLRERSRPEEAVALRCQSPHQAMW